MKLSFKYFLVFTYILSLSFCSNELTDTTSIPLIVDVRMEVQILDSTYKLYSRPFTKIYFTTYKVQEDGNIVNFDQSDTTSCPHGWGVKLLNYKLNSENEKIVLGVACDSFNGLNYQEVQIDYNEAERRIDTLNHSNIIKTFAIYYN
jgi:hypothetical protein